jgi:hypothetical protein
MAWSLANAFETPIRPAPEGGFVKNSIEAMEKYWGKLCKVYGNEDIKTCVLSLEDDVTLSVLKGSKKDTETEWLDCVLSELDSQEA